MKINVDSISLDGGEIEERIDHSKFPIDITEQGITFDGQIYVKANFKRIGGELFVDVFLEAPVECTCARCLAKVKNIFKKKFNINYEVKQRNVIEMDEDIRQEILLDYPIKVVCKADCRGLCPNCGQNLNITKCDCGQ